MNHAATIKSMRPRRRQSSGVLIIAIIVLIYILARYGSSIPWFIR